MKKYMIAILTIILLMAAMSAYASIQMSASTISFSDGIKIRPGVDTIAIGNSAQSTHIGSVALGSGAITSDTVATAGAVIRGQEYVFAGNVPIGTLSIGSTDKERTLSNLAAGRVTELSTDAVNGSQLYAAYEAIEKLNLNSGGVVKDIANIHHRIDVLDTDIKTSGALSAALSALKPLQFDPREPLQIMGGYGYYRGTHAGAIGLAYYASERLLLHAGGSFTEDESMVNAGVSVKIGRKSNIPDRYKAGVISSIAVMQAEIAELKTELSELRGQRE